MLPKIRIYFYIEIDGQYLASGNDEDYQSDSISNLSGDFDETKSFNVRDDISVVKIRIFIYDEEAGTTDDIIDIDGANGGSSEEYQRLDLTLYLKDGIWTGDDTTGYTDGADDGDDDEDWNGELKNDIYVDKRPW